MNVREAMTADVDACGGNDSLQQCAQVMKRDNVGCIPVVDDNNQLIGIITDRDLVIRAIAEGVDCGSAPVYQYMTPKPITIGPDSSLEDAARLMARYQIRRLPVLEGDQLIGMLSFGDISVQLTESGEEDLVAKAVHDVSTPLHKAG